MKSSKSFVELRSMAIVSLFVTANSFAYEIQNHADMSQIAAEQLSSLRSLDKLERLGLRRFELRDAKQTFPVEAKPLGDGLPQDACYGEYYQQKRDANGKLEFTTEAGKTIPLYVKVGSDSTGYGGASTGFTSIPTGLKPNETIPMSIAQALRWGACYEDETAHSPRSLAHFYNVQGKGQGITFPINILPPFGPGSLQWTLSRDASATANPSGPTTRVGTNHFTYNDARDYFYLALTVNNPRDRNAGRQERAKYWGLTFQALGHVIHHVQDMASPQHVRNDAHCSDPIVCGTGIAGKLDGYRPSAYEFLWSQEIARVRTFAQQAGSPIIFPLPRQFWNANTDNALNTINPTRPMTKQQGIAAYAATNFTSVATDFVLDKNDNSVKSSNVQPLPRPAVTGIKAVSLPEIARTNPRAATPEMIKAICGDTTDKCKVEFLGTEHNPDARTTSTSLLSKAGLPEGSFTTDGYFKQNILTYEEAASKLLPAATEYSAGMIDYFFRGELEVLPPANGLYTILDLNDSGSNCINDCGFKALRARVRNKTPLIVDPSGAQGVGATAAVEQAAGNGQLVAVVKYSLNSCYKADGTGEPGPNFNAAMCLLGGKAPSDETALPEEFQSVSIPLPVPQGLVSSSELNPPELRFDFSSQPIPVNAWNLRLQIVFRGVLGIEADGIAVGLTRIPAPSIFRVFNESDWFLAKRLPEPAPPAQPIAELIKVSDLVAAPQKAAISATVFPDGTTRYSGTCIDDVTPASAAAGSPRQYALKPYLKANSFPIQLRVSSSNQATRTLATVEIPADGVVSYAAILGTNVTLTTFTQQSNARIETVTGGVTITNGPDDWTLIEPDQSARGREWLFDETNPSLANRLTLPKPLKSYRGSQFTDAISRNGWMFAGCPSRSQYYVNQNPIQQFGFTLDAAAFTNRPQPANKVTLGAINF
jgi:hypothetical protein